MRGRGGPTPKGWRKLKRQKANPKCKRQTVKGKRQTRKCKRQHQKCKRQTKSAKGKLKNAKGRPKNARLSCLFPETHFSPPLGGGPIECGNFSYHLGTALQCIPVLKIAAGFNYHFGYFVAMYFSKSVAGLIAFEHPANKNKRSPTINRS